MTVLEAHGVGVAWTASISVITKASFVLSPGFYGLVGANGAGKTTLLRVLAGELVPHEGTVRVRPDDACIVHCPQTVDEPGPDVFDLASAYDGFVYELKGRLGLDQEALARWPTLSPGERKRWQIGAALARKPDVLLLDEPTNHLDGSARDRLLGALSRFRGIGVIVSHDRAVLERLPRAILRVHDGNVTLFPGRWSEARAIWEAARHQEEATHAEAKVAVEAAERRLHAARRTQEAAAGSLSARSRMKGKNDHDARSMGRKVVAGWADGQAGRAVERVRNELERAEAQVTAIRRDATVGGKVFAAYRRATQPTLFHLDEPELIAGQRAVLRNVRVSIGREDRLRIVGDNGAGKTTLLRALLAVRGDDDRILYLPQELLPADVARMLAELREASDEARGRILSVFSALGSDPERILSRRSEGATALSPGEARKLALASGLGRHVWAMVLDEPTNHLDLPTIERLEAALSAYPGCVVLVSHDDAFARAVTTRSLCVDAGTVR